MSGIRAGSHALTSLNLLKHGVQMYVDREVHHRHLFENSKIIYSVLEVLYVSMGEVEI